MVINVGVNIQKGQKLLINCPVDCAYFARMAMEEAYKSGAEDVMIEWADEYSDRINYLLAPDSNFGKEIAWKAERFKYLVDEGYNFLAVEASDPEILKDVDPERIQKNQRAARKIRKPFSDKVSSYEIQWCIACVPTIAWAKKVFPNAKNDDEAMELMWDAVFHATRIDDNDPIKNWESHIENLIQKRDALMKHNFKYIHFKNSLGTDLEIQLPKDHIWVSSGEKAGTGYSNVPNIPTEEVFTAPLKNGVNGIVYSTKPLTYMGDIADDFWLRFKDGKVIEYGAKKNKHILEMLLYTHKNGDYLGEVALVPYDSPISKSGITWYNTLYDENSSCHLGLGNASKTNIKGGAGKSDDELDAMGINRCLASQEITVGSSDLEIIGVTHDGKEVAVFKEGNFVI